MMRVIIINATRWKWSGEAIFNIERSSLWRRRWADFDRYAAGSFVAQDNRTSPTPEAAAGPACSPDGAKRNPGTVFIWATTAPDYAEFIIGPGKGRTRWLHPGNGISVICARPHPRYRTGMRDDIDS
jgi:hypothetical protein